MGTESESAMSGNRLGQGVTIWRRPTHGMTIYANCQSGECNCKTAIRGFFPFCSQAIPTTCRNFALHSGFFHFWSFYIFVCLHSDSFTVSWLGKFSMGTHSCFAFLGRVLTPGATTTHGVCRIPSTLDESRITYFGDLYPIPVARILIIKYVLVQIKFEIYQFWTMQRVILIHLQFERSCSNNIYAQEKGLKSKSKFSADSDTRFKTKKLLKLSYRCQCDCESPWPSKQENVTHHFISWNTPVVYCNCKCKCNENGSKN